MDNNQKVLIVEDDRFLRELYEELLSEEGFDVTTAEDGEIGFNKLHEGGYDIVLLDILLPKKDGLEILREIKKTGTQKSNGPIILLTNLGQESIVKEGFELGAASYLIKSALTPDQVLHEVRTVLAKKN